jgi:phage-related tail protein
MEGQHEYLELTMLEKMNGSIETMKRALREQNKEWEQTRKKRY